jgi:glycosyltransferase involved in cell wall biosynthesis
MNRPVVKNSADIAQLRLVFLSDAIQNRNGVGTYYHDLVAHLKDHLQRVELLCPGANSKARYQGPALPLPGDPTQKVYLPHPRRIAKKIRKLAPHIIIAPTPGPFGLLGFLLAKRMRIPLCVGYHTQYETLADLYWTHVIGQWTSKSLVWLEGCFFRAGSVVVTNSDAMATHAKKSGAPDVQMVGTPIAKHFLTTPVIPLSPQIRSVLYAGRLAPEKNINAVIEAAKSLPRIQFIIAGDGPLRDFVQTRTGLQANLDYMGWISRHKLMQVMDRSDLLVLPSKVEAFGTIALEAMARRKMVLVSPHCGILNWQSLARGLFQIQRDENLAEAIQRIEKLDFQQRNETAATAQYSAIALNAKTVDDWLAIFRCLTQQSFDHSHTN